MTGHWKPKSALVTDPVVTLKLLSTLKAQGRLSLRSLSTYGARPRRRVSHNPGMSTPKPYFSEMKPLRVPKSIPCRA